MAEDKTHSVESDSDDTECASFECQFGVGRGFLHRLLENRTPATPIQPTEMTLPNVSVVVQSDVREPPSKGDGSDKFTVHEWGKSHVFVLNEASSPRL